VGCHPVLIPRKYPFLVKSDTLAARGQEKDQEEQECKRDHHGNGDADFVEELGALPGVLPFQLEWVRLEHLSKVHFKHCFNLI